MSEYLVTHEAEDGTFITDPVWFDTMSEAIAYGTQWAPKPNEFRVLYRAEQVRILQEPPA